MPRALTEGSGSVTLNPLGILPTNYKVCFLRLLPLCSQMGMNVNIPGLWCEHRDQYLPCLQAAQGPCLSVSGLLVIKSLLSAFKQLALNEQLLPSGSLDIARVKKDVFLSSTNLYLLEERELQNYNQTVTKDAKKIMAGCHKNRREEVASIVENHVWPEGLGSRSSTGKNRAHSLHVLIYS